MPTYKVTVPRGHLDTSQKMRIAQAITRVHSDTTGAPRYFASATCSPNRETNRPGRRRYRNPIAR